jgi:hypothetical protein
MRGEDVAEYVMCWTKRIVRDVLRERSRDAMGHISASYRCEVEPETDEED